MEKIVIGSSRKRALLYLLLNLVSVAGAILYLVLGNSPWVGWLSIVLFGTCAGVSTFRLFDQRPRVVIDETGVFDRTLKVGVINWEDIRAVFLETINGEPFICLDIADRSKYTSRLSPLLRGMVALNRMLGFTDLSLNLAHTGVDPERVLELMSKELAARHPPAAV